MQRTRLPARLLAALPLVALLSASCDDHLFPKIGEESYDPDWAGVNLLMADHCVACHSTTPPILPDAIEADLVSGDGVWVTPGDPSTSELYLVLVDQSTDSPAMPFGEPLLPETVTDAVATWITDGANLE